jgi:hypothetical protein
MEDSFTIRKHYVAKENQPGDILLKLTANSIATIESALALTSEALSAIKSES